MKTPIQYIDFIEVYNLARDLALALADETMYLENLGKVSGCDGPSENSLRLLAQARNELNLAEQFDELDGLKWTVIKTPERR